MNTILPKGFQNRRKQIAGSNVPTVEETILLEKNLI